MENIKIAGISDTVLNSLKGIGLNVDEITHIKEKPFEILFKYLGTGYIFFKYGLLTNILIGIASAFGYGPSWIGKKIDSLLGFGEGRNPAITDSSLKGASEGIVSSLLSKITSSSSLFRERLIMRNGNFEIEDLIAAWSAGPDKQIVVNAMGLDFIKKMFSRSGGVKAKSSLVSALFGLLKYLSAGVLINTGIDYVKKKVILNENKNESKQEGSTNTSNSENITWRRYKNTNGVESSIIKILNTIASYKGKNFSQLFEKFRGKPLFGSNEMGDILEYVRRAHNWGPINEIDRYNTFVAPDPKFIVRKLLPEFSYTKQTNQINTPTKKLVNNFRKPKTVKDIDKEFIQTLGG